MPIKPGVYEPSGEARGGTGIGVGPARTGGDGGSLQPEKARPLDLIKPPSTLKELGKAATHVFGVMAEAEERQRKLALDNEVDFYHAQYKEGLKSIRLGLDSDGVGTGPGAYQQYGNEYRKRAGELDDKIRKSISPEAYPQFMRKAYGDYFENKFLADKRGDELLKDDTFRSHWLKVEDAKAQAANLGLPEYPLNAASPYAFKGLQEVTDHTDHLVQIGAISPKVVEEVKEKERKDIIEARAEAMLREEPATLRKKMLYAQQGDWFHRLPEERRNHYVNRAEAEMKQQDSLANAAEAKRKKDMEDGATLSVAETLRDAPDKAHSQLFYYRSIGAVDDTTFRAWESFIESAAQRSLKVVEDPNYLLPILMNPEKANVGQLARDVKDGKLGHERAVSIVLQKRNFETAMQDKAFSEAYTEGKTFIDRTFGWTPFADWKNDPRSTAHLAAYQEFTDAINKGLERGATVSADQIRTLRDDIIKRQAPSMKTAVQDHINSLKRGVPGTFREGITPEENMAIFEENVRKRPGLYSPAQADLYRKRYREIIQWNIRMQEMGASEHSNTPTSSKQGGRRF